MGVDLWARVFQALGVEIRPWKLPGEQIVQGNHAFRQQERRNGLAAPVLADAMASAMRGPGKAVNEVLVQVGQAVLVNTGARIDRLLKSRSWSTDE